MCPRPKICYNFSQKLVNKKHAVQLTSFPVDGWGGEECVAWSRGSQSWCTAFVIIALKKCFRVFPLVMLVKLLILCKGNILDLFLLRMVWTNLGRTMLSVSWAQTNLSRQCTNVTGLRIKATTFYTIVIAAKIVCSLEWLWMFLCLSRENSCH